VIREDYRYKLVYLCLLGFSGPFGQNLLGGQNRGMGGAMLTPNELVLTFGGYLAATFSEN